MIILNFGKPNVRLEKTGIKTNKTKKKVNSKFNINLDDETLSKGIVSIKDNYTNEEIKLDEADILEYVLGNI